MCKLYNTHIESQVELFNKYSFDTNDRSYILNYLKSIEIYFFAGHYFFSKIAINVCHLVYMLPIQIRIVIWDECQKRTEICQTEGFDFFHLEREYYKLFNKEDPADLFG